MKKRTIAWVIVISISLPGLCLAADGDNFLGRWYLKETQVKEVCDLSPVLEISKLGGLFTIEEKAFRTDGKQFCFGRGGVEAEYSNKCLQGKMPQMQLLACLDGENLIIKFMGGKYLLTREQPKPDLSRMYNPDLYKENTQVSAVLEREGIKIGLSKDEAIRTYGFDKIEVDSDGSTSMINSKLKDKEGEFYSHIPSGSKSVIILNKTISIQDRDDQVNLFDLDKTLKQKYGTAGSVSGNGYRIKHNGRYISFGINVVHPIGKTKVFFYTVDDTERVLEQLRSQQQEQKKVDQTQKLKDRL